MDEIGVAEGSSGFGVLLDGLGLVVLAGAREVGAPVLYAFQHGPYSNQRMVFSLMWATALDQGQSSGRAHKFAVTGFLST